MAEGGTKKQKWICDECGCEGTVEYGPDNADVMSVVHLIRADHRSASPVCDQPVGLIRVVAEEGGAA